MVQTQACRVGGKGCLTVFGGWVVTRTYHVQKRLDHRYEMTLQGQDDQTRPIGYCAGWVERTREDWRKVFPWANESYIEELLRQYEVLKEHQGKYHSDGHPTRGEAFLCYREFQFDNELHFSREKSIRGQCDVCDASASWSAHLGEFDIFSLCDQHNSPLGVRQALALKSGRGATIGQ